MSDLSRSMSIIETQTTGIDDYEGIVLNKAFLVANCCIKQ